MDGQNVYIYYSHNNNKNSTIFKLYNYITVAQIKCTKIRNILTFFLSIQNIPFLLRKLYVLKYINNKYLGYWFYYYKSRTLIYTCRLWEYLYYNVSIGNFRNPRFLHLLFFCAFCQRHVSFFEYLIVNSQYCQSSFSY